MSQKIAILPGMESLKISAFADGYTGGKEGTGIWQKIINEIRPHDIFISGCLGNCAIARHKLPAKRNYGIDIDPSVIDAWNEMKWEWITLIHGDVIAAVSQLLAMEDLKEKRICLFLDPTYRMSSIKSDRPPYKFTMEDEWHHKFLSEVQKWSLHPNLDILITHYPDPLYKRKLKEWRRIPYLTKTRRGPVEEWLFMNYEHESGELHDYRWIGDNKDERYNLKNRTAKNLIKKLNRMEVRKKQAIIYYMKEWLKNEVQSTA
ncbi:MAG: hypothetical protein AAF620_01055 [Bacteroidota bacterium]